MQRRRRGILYRGANKAKVVSIFGVVSADKVCYTFSKWSETNVGSKRKNQNYIGRARGRLD